MLLGKIQIHTGVIVLPTQTMRCYKGIPQNYHKFASSLIPLKWVEFNDPSNSYTVSLAFGF